jgi:MOSC domain-containing protein YiiM
MLEGSEPRGTEPIRTAQCAKPRVAPPAIARHAGGVSRAALAPETYLRARAEIVQLNVSEGGVPKLPIGRAIVDALGIVGDKHRDGKHHGGPDRALCLYALELIEALRSEGHPILAGSAGENITTRGLDWSRLARGRKLLLGEVIAEFTDWATPCRTIAGCFASGAFQRTSHKLHPGWSRAYARVLRGGVIAPGDRIAFAE